MNEVLASIEIKKQEFAQLPFFEFLRDKSIDPRKRLSWTPAFAPFAMNFKDFNRVTLVKKPASSKIQEIINHHADEDGRHWAWFLQDMKLLGFDYSMNFTDVLKFLWSDEIQKLRQLSHNLFAMCTFEDDVLMKLVIIESIEAIGNIFSFETANITKELQQITKHHYPYFGESHHAVEQGHIQINNAEQFLENIQLTEIQNDKAFVLVERVFTDFTAAMDEMLIFAQNHSDQESWIKTDKRQLLKIST